jgi:hypothetical protein
MKGGGVLIRVWVCSPEQLVSLPHFLSQLNSLKLLNASLKEQRGKIYTMLKYIEFSIGEPKFEHELRAIAFIYQYEISRLQLIKQEQIKVHIVSGQDEKIWITPLELSGRIIVVNYNENITNYERMDRKEKLIFLTRIIHESLVFLFDKLNLDNSFIVGIKDRILETNLNIELVLPLKRNKKIVSYKAHVFVKPEIDSFDYYLRIIIDEIEHNLLIYRGSTAYLFYMSNLFYHIILNDSYIEIKSRKKKVSLKVDIEKSSNVVMTYSNSTTSDILDMYACDSSSVYRFMMFDI